MSVFCNLGRTPWFYRAFSYQRLFADAEKGPMQIALGQSDICEFESYMPSHAVRSLWAKRRASFRQRPTSRRNERRAPAPWCNHSAWAAAGSVDSSLNLLG